jgi:ribosome recycling factor
VQKAKVTHIFAEDLREAISNVKRDEYRRALDGAHDPKILDAIQHKIRTDSQLTQEDRIQLLGDVERAADLSK